MDLNLEMVREQVRRHIERLELLWIEREALRLVLLHVHHVSPERILEVLEAAKKEPAMKEAAQKEFAAWRKQLEDISLEIVVEEGMNAPPKSDKLT